MFGKALKQIRQPPVPLVPVMPAVSGMKLVLKVALFKQRGEAFEWTAWLFELGICLVAALSLPVLAAWKALPGALNSPGVLKTIR